MSVDEGSIHGRFQPFHRGHLEYAIASAARCEVLWVGITQPASGALRDGVDQPQHRHRGVDNPLTYWERLVVITAALRAAGVAAERLRIVPFPIEEPASLSEYMPASVMAFTTVYDEWNRRKIQLLRDVGYSVTVLWERDQKVYSGGDVRKLMREGDPAWRDSVPEGALQALDRLRIPARLRLGE